MKNACLHLIRVERSYIYLSSACLTGFFIRIHRWLLTIELLHKCEQKLTHLTPTALWDHFTPLGFFFSFLSFVQLHTPSYSNKHACCSLAFWQKDCCEGADMFWDESLSKESSWTVKNSDLRFLNFCFYAFEKKKKKSYLTTDSSTLICCLAPLFCTLWQWVDSLFRTHCCISILNEIQLTFITWHGQHVIDGNAWTILAWTLYGLE